MKNVALFRRQFLGYFSAAGLTGTLLPGVLWAQVERSGAARITKEMLGDAIKVAGLQISEEEQAAMLAGVNQNLARFEAIRKIKIPNDVSMPFHFSALVPGMGVDHERRPFRPSKPPAVKRPADLEDVAFWPVTQLAQLIKTKQVTSLELTQMYLGRLKRYGTPGKINCTVTLLEDLGLAQARAADAEIRAGKYRGPLHGIPWGVKDLYAVKGHPTTWGAAIYKDQVFDYDATVVELLRDAGAVLIAKLATAELAAGDDRWFGGQTMNPWNVKEGASGSSSGSASATAAGLVGFAIGTETSGSILNPSQRCGCTGLRPTHGRSSRYGVMVLAWSQDRPGPFCRAVEDCALVMNAISRQDKRDLSVADIPFNWDAGLNVKKLRVGYLKQAFDEARDAEARARNDRLLKHIHDLGFTPVPVTVPDVMGDVSATDMESATFFDDIVRDGRVNKLLNDGRASRLRNARMVPGVEFLQSQRVRMMMMMELAKATADVDIYFGPVNAGGAGGSGRGLAGEAGPLPAPAGAPAGPGRGNAGQGAAQRHTNMANLATYPALAMPFGLNEAGSPMAVVFYARPYRETELLAFGKVFQDATGYHLKHPQLAV